jgi:hypothetical protein
MLILRVGANRLSNALGSMRPKDAVMSKFEGSGGEVVSAKGAGGVHVLKSERADGMVVTGNPRE